MKKTIFLAAVVAGLAGFPMANAGAQSYSTFNYPEAGVGGATYLTGIRGDGEGGTDNVFMTGVFTPAGSSNTQGLIYRGSITSNTGEWTVVNYPSSAGVTVTSTALYGPNDLGGDNIRAVGSYKTSETGAADIGLLYEGPTDGSGTWTTLNAVSLNINTINTIAHSNHGDLAVGNYDTGLEGKAFVYNIDNSTWFDLNPIGASSITAYGIWHNGGTSYTIAGGFSLTPSVTGLDQGYLVDWDSQTNETSHWQAYNFDNLPVESVVSHFDGITGDGNGGYNLTGDYFGEGAEDGLAFFASVGRDGEGFGEASWTQLSFPESTLTSGNSVYENYVIGIYTEDGVEGAQGYVATVPEPTLTSLLAVAAGLFVLRRKKARP